MVGDLGAVGVLGVEVDAVLEEELAEGLGEVLVVVEGGVGHFFGEFYF